MAEVGRVRRRAAKIYRRFSAAQRLEHLLLIASFTTLALTGLPQMFAGTAWGESLIGVVGGIERVRLIHRFAAIVLMLEAIYHIVSVGYKIVVLRVRLSMFPALQDLRDLIHSIRFNLGRARERPRFGRYSFEHKMEYWAVVWGTLIMIVSGFMLWNPIATTRFLPGEFIPAAKAAHGAEALLAVLAIVTWHVYNAHIRHFNRSIFSGVLSEEEMREEHPLELARIEAGETQPALSPEGKRRRERLILPVAAVGTLALLIGLYFFVTFEETAIATVPRRDGPPVFAPLTPAPSPPRMTPTSVPSPTASPSVAETTPTQPTAPAAPRFASDVLPILEARCAACHGSMGGLSLTDYASILEGGASGPAVIPGAPDESLVVLRQMEPHPSQLTSEELALVRAWILSGAEDN